MVFCKSYHLQDRSEDMQVKTDIQLNKISDSVVDLIYDLRISAA